MIPGLLAMWLDPELEERCRELGPGRVAIDLVRAGRVLVVLYLETPHGDLQVRREPLFSSDEEGGRRRD